MTCSLTLAGYPGNTVHIVCEKRGRYAQYRKRKLVGSFAIPLAPPDSCRLSSRLTKAS